MTTSTFLVLGMTVKKVEMCHWSCHFDNVQQDMLSAWTPHKNM